MPEWVLLQFASARIGVVLVTINPAYRPFELKYVLNQSNARVLFLIDSFKKSDYFAMLGEVCPSVTCEKPGDWSCEDFPLLKSVVSMRGQGPCGSIMWEDFMGQADSIPQSEIDAIAKTLKATDAINIQYTSGTTGFPKAATLSHRNLLLNVGYTGERLRYTEADRICIPVPFYHCFGCVLGTLCAIVFGSAMIVPAESFDAASSLAAIEKERATSIYGVPTMFIAQLNEESFPNRDLTSLRTGIMAGSPCPIETMRAVVSQMHCPEITIGLRPDRSITLITLHRK